MVGRGQSMRWWGRRRKRSVADLVFVAAGITSLAIGVGANAAIFSVTSSLWLRDRGIARPDQVGTVYFRPVARTDGALVASAPTPECQALRLLERASVAFEVLVQSDQAKFMTPRVTLANGERLRTTAVSHDYFKVLGVNIAGRSFLPDDDIADHRVVVASHRFCAHLLSFRLLGGRSNHRPQPRFRDDRWNSA